MKYLLAILFCFTSVSAHAEYVAGRNQATQKVLSYISENGVYPLQLTEVFKKTLESLKAAIPQLNLTTPDSHQYQIQCQNVSASLNVTLESDLNDLFNQLKPVLEACATTDELKEKMASSESYENFVLGHFVGAYHPKARYYKPNPLDIYRDGANGAVGLVLTMSPQGIEIASTVAGSPAEAVGLKPGDRIVKIGGNDVSQLKLEEAALKLRGMDGSKIDITIIPRGETSPKVITIVRQNMIVKGVQFDVIGTLGYLKIASFDPSTLSDFDLALNHFNEKAITGLIMDLRNNDGGLIETAIRLADRFLSGTLTIVSLTGQTPQTFKITPKENQIKWPMVVLVNRKTASAAEVLAGALKDHNRATLIGEKTAGKGSVRTVFTINDYKMEIPVALAITPKGHAIEGAGLVPDKIIADTTIANSPAEVGDPIVQAALANMAPYNKQIGSGTLPNTLPNVPAQPTPPPAESNPPPQPIQVSEPVAAPVPQATTQQTAPQTVEPAPLPPQPAPVTYTDPSAPIPIPPLPSTSTSAPTP